jgi:ABC-type transport system involved in cytochrome bd biosynthesis fused ATPase/permease subunit
MRILRISWEMLCCLSSAIRFNAWKSSIVILVYTVFSRFFVVIMSVHRKALFRKQVEAITALSKVRIGYVFNDNSLNLWR